MEYSILNKKLNDGRTDYEITYKNAYIHLIVGKDYYNTDKQSIEFDLILGHIYSKWDKNKNAAPKGLARNLLCKLLLELIEKNVINKKSIILLEAEPSLKEKLLDMYKGMGFKIEEYIDKKEYPEFKNNRFKEYSDGAVMTATVGKVLNWCSKKYNIKSNKGGKRKLMKKRKSVKRINLLKK